jgi:unsaturated rhamnogalacturonyl hydrolase
MGSAGMGGCLCRGFATNVFAVFGLEPSTAYGYTIESVAADAGQAPAGGRATGTFSTPVETICLDVRRFGAVGDGKTVDTAALAAAIACCPPGGTVMFPPGEYLSGPLFLKSHMTLYLEKGAVLKGVPDRDAYPILPGVVEPGAATCVRGQPHASEGCLPGMPEAAPQGGYGLHAIYPTPAQEYLLGSWEGNPLDTYASLINAIGCEDVTVAGEGVVDGGGKEGGWWANPSEKHKAWRARTFFLCGCGGVKLVGLTVRNSPSWTIHPYRCADVSLLCLSIRNPPDSANTDGIDPESCDGLRILGTHISVGDDCIAIKSGKLYMGTAHAMPSKKILIEQCLMERGHGAVVIGSEVSSGAWDVTIRRCLFRHTDRGIRIKTRRGRGRSSVVQGIRCEHIRMDGVMFPFTANMFYNCDPDGHSPYVQGRAPLAPDDMTPRVRGIELEDVACTGCAGTGIYLLGLPESPIEDVHLKDVVIEFDVAGNPHAPLPVMADGIEPAPLVGIHAENVVGLEKEGVRFVGASGEGTDGVMSALGTGGELPARGTGGEVSARGTSAAEPAQGASDEACAQEASGEASVRDAGDAICAQGAGEATDVPGQRQESAIIARLLAFSKELMGASTPERPAWNKELLRKIDEAGGAADADLSNTWNYVDACMISAFLSLHEVTGDGEYLSFCDGFLSWFVNEDGSINRYDPRERNLDNIRPAKNLFALYDVTGREKYRKAMDVVRAQLDGMPRTKENCFWHKAIYPWQVWLDGLYMAQPFYMEYETRYARMAMCRDSFAQFEAARHNLLDDRTGLYVHGYDESRSMYWADPVTGKSPNPWLRAIGWFFLALVETLEVTDERLFYEYRTLRGMLRDLADALLRFQGADGMFLQLPDKPDLPGNYPETSGTMLLGAGFLKGARLGYLAPMFAEAGRRAFWGTARRYLRVGGSDILGPGAGGSDIHLGGICLVAGLGGAQHRDGSAAYYLGEPVVEDEGKGVAPMFMALAELMKGATTPRPFVADPPL